MKNDNHKQTIVIFGSSHASPDSSEYKQAYETGKILAQAGYQLANGGYGGTMAAVARAAHENGSSTIGVTCNAFGRSGPNQWVSREIRTANLYERLDTLMQLGDGFVVLPGSSGTLLELACCLELVNKKFLSPRPIICLSDTWQPVIETIFGNPKHWPAYICCANNVNDILALLRDFKNH